MPRRMRRRGKKKLAASQARAFEEAKPAALRADVRMISGCEDAQTSADIKRVDDYHLPDPAGRAGGACTSTLLNILYKDETTPEDTMSFTQVLTQMREDLKQKKFQQVPQLTSSKPIDMNVDFDLVPPEATGTRRAVMIGINYIGQSQGVLSGCHNDVKNMKKYIMDVHGFAEENITVLMDDDEHTSPTRDNILEAYKALVAATEPGDAVFLHYSGHGAKIRDDDGDEEDGFDETLVPVDYKQSGMIRDDDLYDIIVKQMPQDVHLVCLFDCCHSGTVLDLPYVFKPGEDEEMKIDAGFDFDTLFQKFGASEEAQGLLTQLADAFEAS